VHPAFDLVNSNHGVGLGLPDVLEDERWLARYVHRWGFGGARRRRGDTARLRELRVLLRRLVDRLDAGKGLSAADRAELGRFLAGAHYTRQFPTRGFALELVPEKRDWDWVLAEIAGSFVDYLSDGQDRIKACHNPDCRFAFYDQTKNRSRRWCDDRTCGNRFKVQRFRARHRAARTRG
jgi:predicted RNA-binding Zn ribbon-like protein